MPKIVIQYFPTDHGELILGAFEGGICLCDWRYRRMREAVDTRIQRGLGAAYEEGASPVMEAAMQQLIEYFAGERRTFDLPLRMVGTDFQVRVWEALRAIPYGTTMTYASLTATVTEPNAIRAVASANGANAISIMVPCHRVIGSNRELVGYAGGLLAKRKLLQLEAAIMGKAELDLFSAQVVE